EPATGAAQPNPNVRKILDTTTGAVWATGGATGSDGSPWCPLGDRLVAAGFASSIVLCPIAVGGASGFEWAPSGQYNHRLADALERLRKTDRKHTLSTAVHSS